MLLRLPNSRFFKRLCCYVNMSAVLEYRKIRVSSKNEVKMLNTLLSTSQQFKAISKDEYFVTKKQCALLTKKNIPYQKL